MKRHVSISFTVKELEDLQAVLSGNYPDLTQHFMRRRAKLLAKLAVALCDTE